MDRADKWWSMILCYPFPGVLSGCCGGGPEPDSPESFCCRSLPVGCVGLHPVLCGGMVMVFLVDVLLYGSSLKA